MATGVRTDFRVRTDRPSRVSRALVSMVVLVEQAGLRELAAEEHVVDDVEVVAQREVLVDDLDAEGVRVAWAVHRDGLALEEVLARRRRRGCRRSP